MISLDTKDQNQTQVPATSTLPDEKGKGKEVDFSVVSDTEEWGDMWAECNALGTFQCDMVNVPAGNVGTTSIIPTAAASLESSLMAPYPPPPSLPNDPSWPQIHNFRDLSLIPTYPSPPSLVSDPAWPQNLRNLHEYSPRLASQYELTQIEVDNQPPEDILGQFQPDMEYEGFPLIEEFSGPTIIYDQFMVCPYTAMQGAENPTHRAPSAIPDPKAKAKALDSFTTSDSEEPRDNKWAEYPFPCEMSQIHNFRNLPLIPTYPSPPSLVNDPTWPQNLRNIHEYPPHLASQHKLTQIEVDDQLPEDILAQFQPDMEYEEGFPLVEQFSGPTIIQALSDSADLAFGLLYLPLNITKVSAVADDSNYEYEEEGQDEDDDCWGCGGGGGGGDESEEEEPSVYESWNGPRGEETEGRWWRRAYAREKRALAKQKPSWA
ncbi:uncharacterized protein EDB91DRAFT_1246420 [Suillus paluster]|uniref:uncharacterized protein n=1 Tax=Suillus paluster TaxID=48578 RepID=UPI001B86DEF8|nr:uncharacterized protein EDB91DRAFT_1246420 [Suillus paluster]KAG1745544.1 hypothetical protein EDB91DRAFT_1246420 [Suillus paluster]